MRLKKTVLLTLLIVAQVLASIPGYCWLSGDESTPGPPMVQRVLKPADEGNEHGQLMLRAFQAAGIPDYLTNATYSFDVYVKGGVNTPRDFREVDGIVSRSMNVAGLAALPDHAYSLWDFLSGFSVCPKGTLDGDFYGSTEEAVQCHTFKSHMGAVNSNHFPPQAGETYTWYHQLALESAEECAQLIDVENDSLSGLEVGALSSYVLECRLRSLALEAFGQHFLQDVWAVGHMWERWGSTNLEHFESPSRVRALLVALTTGLVHGCDAAVESCSGDELSAGQKKAFITTIDSAPQDGIGDKYLADLDSNSSYSLQKQMLEECTKSGVMEVYGAFDRTSSNRPRDPVGRECLGQRNTNSAMASGWGANFWFDVGGTDSPFLVITAATSIVGGFISDRLENEFKADYYDVEKDIKAYGKLFPDQTHVARGFGLKDLLGVGPNSSPNPGGFGDSLPGPTASFIDPDTFGVIYNPEHVLTTQELNFPGSSVTVPIVHTEKVMKRAFNKAYIKPLCSDPEVDPNTLKERVTTLIVGGVTSGSEYDTALAVCTEFASRHIEVSGEPSLCDAIGAGGPTISGIQLGFELISASTERKVAAEAWCSEGRSIAYHGLIDGKLWAQPNQFINTSLNEINDVCPGGQCSGYLKGFRMDGWTWASRSRVAALFSSYGVFLQFGQDEVHTIFERSSHWAPAFFANGWTPTDTIEEFGGESTGYVEVCGRYRPLFQDDEEPSVACIRDTFLVVEEEYPVRIPVGLRVTGSDFVTTMAQDIEESEYAYNPYVTGGWFYRNPQ